MGMVSKAVVKRCLCFHTCWMAQFNNYASDWGLQVALAVNKTLKISQVGRPSVVNKQNKWVSITKAGQASVWFTGRTIFYSILYFAAAQSPLSNCKQSPYWILFSPLRIDTPTFQTKNKQLKLSFLIDFPKNTTFNWLKCFTLIIKKLKTAIVTGTSSPMMPCQNEIWGQRGLGHSPQQENYLILNRHA